MNGTIIPDTPIAVDFFKIRQCPSAKLFFLTHMHADHTVGLSSVWGRTVYCSPITGRLLQRKFKLADSLIHTLEVGEAHTVFLDDSQTEQMTVTPLDANHCPGSVMYLFQGYFGNILHTGDFRYCSSMCDIGPLSYGLNIDVLYLDNTYCYPGLDVPPRQQATQKIIDIIESHPRHRVLMVLRQLGKEDLLVKLAKHFKAYVSVEAWRYALYEELELPAIFTQDQNVGRILTIATNRFNAKVLEKLNLRCPTIAIIPTALYTILNNHPLSENQNVYVVPYSDHSSLPELKEFVSRVRPVKIIPVVKDKSVEGKVLNTSSMHHFDSYLSHPDILRNKEVPESVKAFMGYRHVYRKKNIKIIPINRDSPVSPSKTKRGRKPLFLRKVPSGYSVVKGVHFYEESSGQSTKIVSDKVETPSTPQSVLNLQKNDLGFPVINIVPLDDSCGHARPSSQVEEVDVQGVHGINGNGEMSAQEHVQREVSLDQENQTVGCERRSSPNHTTSQEDQKPKELFGEKVNINQSYTSLEATGSDTKDQIQDWGWMLLENKVKVESDMDSQEQNFLQSHSAFCIGQIKVEPTGDVQMESLSGRTHSGQTLTLINDHSYTTAMPDKFGIKFQPCVSPTSTEVNSTAEQNTGTSLAVLDADTSNLTQQFNPTILSVSSLCKSHRKIGQPKILKTQKQNLQVSNGSAGKTKTLSLRGKGKLCKPKFKKQQLRLRDKGKIGKRKSKTERLQVSSGLVRGANTLELKEQSVELESASQPSTGNFTVCKHKTVSDKLNTKEGSPLKQVAKRIGKKVKSASFAPKYSLKMKESKKIPKSLLQDQCGSMVDNSIYNFDLHENSHKCLDSRTGFSEDVYRTQKGHISEKDHIQNMPAECNVIIPALASRVKKKILQERRDESGCKRVKYGGRKRIGAFDNIYSISGEDNFENSGIDRSNCCQDEQEKETMASVTWDSCGHLQNAGNGIHNEHRVHDPKTNRVITQNKCCQTKPLEDVIALAIKQNEKRDNRRVICSLFTKEDMEDCQVQTDVLVQDDKECQTNQILGLAKIDLTDQIEDNNCQADQIETFKKPFLSEEKSCQTDHNDSVKTIQYEEENSYTNPSNDAVLATLNYDKGCQTNASDVASGLNGDKDCVSSENSVSSAVNEGQNGQADQSKHTGNNTLVTEDKVCQTDPMDDYILRALLGDDTMNSMNCKPMAFMKDSLLELRDFVMGSQSIRESQASTNELNPVEGLTLHDFVLGSPAERDILRETLTHSDRMTSQSPISMKTSNRVPNTLENNAANNQQNAEQSMTELQDENQNLTGSKDQCMKMCSVNQEEGTRKCSEDTDMPATSGDMKSYNEPNDSSNESCENSGTLTRCVEQTGERRPFNFENKDVFTVDVNCERNENKTDAFADRNSPSICTRDVSDYPANTQPFGVNLSSQSNTDSVADIFSDPYKSLSYNLSDGNDARTCESEHEVSNHERKLQPEEDELEVEECERSSVTGQMFKVMRLDQTDCQKDLGVETISHGEISKADDFNDSMLKMCKDKSRCEIFKTATGHSVGSLYESAKPSNSGVSIKTVEKALLPYEGDQSLRGEMPELVRRVTKKQKKTVQTVAIVKKLRKERTDVHDHSLNLSKQISVEVKTGQYPPQQLNEQTVAQNVGSSSKTNECIATLDEYKHSESIDTSLFYGGSQVLQDSVELETSLKDVKHSNKKPDTEQLTEFKKPEPIKTKETLVTKDHPEMNIITDLQNAGLFVTVSKAGSNSDSKTTPAYSNDEACTRLKDVISPETSKSKLQHIPTLGEETENSSCYSSPRSPVISPINESSRKTKARASQKRSISLNVFSEGCNLSMLSVKRVKGPTQKLCINNSITSDYNDEEMSFRLSFVPDCIEHSTEESEINDMEGVQPGYSRSRKATTPKQQKVTLPNERQVSSKESCGLCRELRHELKHKKKSSLLSKQNSLGVTFLMFEESLKWNSAQSRSQISNQCKYPLCNLSVIPRQKQSLKPSYKSVLSVKKHM